MVEAAWELHARLQALAPPADGNGAVAPGAAAAAAAAAGVQDPGGAAGGGGDGQEGRLPPAMAGMAAVGAQRQRLHGLQRSFVDKACAYLQEEFGRIAEPVLQRLAAQQGAARLDPPDHGPLRRRAAELAPLLEVVGVLRPAATVAPREAYCAAVNSLLRREVHGAASEARRMAAAADAGGAHEPDLLDRAAAADSAGCVAGCRKEVCAGCSGVSPTCLAWDASVRALVFRLRLTRPTILFVFECVQHAGEAERAAGLRARRVLPLPLRAPAGPLRLVPGRRQAPAAVAVQGLPACLPACWQAVQALRRHARRPARPLRAPPCRRPGGGFHLAGCTPTASLPHPLPSFPLTTGIAPIHEGWQALLDAHVPVLAEEAAQLIGLAFPRAQHQQGPQQPQQAQQQGGGVAASKAVRFAGGGGGAAAAAAAAPAPPDVGGAEVQGALASLLAGLDSELLGLIGSVKPQRALLCLPMLGATLGWKQRLAARGPALRPLVALLAQCEARLAAALQAYFAERAAAVQR